MNKVTLTYKGHIEGHKCQKLFFPQNEMKRRENMFPCCNKVTVTYKDHIQGHKGQNIFFQNEIKRRENMFSCGNKKHTCPLSQKITTTCNGRPWTPSAYLL